MWEIPYDSSQGTRPHFVSKYVIFQNGQKIDILHFSVLLVSMECIFGEILSTSGLVIKITLIWADSIH